MKTMTCDELLQAMNAYVDGELEPGFCTAFEEHLAGCNPCQIIVDNIRNTITLYRDGEPYSVSAKLNQKLRECLRAKWLELYPES